MPPPHGDLFAGHPQHLGVLHGLLGRPRPLPILIAAFQELFLLFAEPLVVSTHVRHLFKSFAHLQLRKFCSSVVAIESGLRLQLRHGGSALELELGPGCLLRRGWAAHVYPTPEQRSLHLQR